MERSDEQLLAAGGSLEFGLFYRRYAQHVLAYFARRVRDAEAAADLTAETFAAAAVARERFRPERGSAVAWLTASPGTSSPTTSGADAGRTARGGSSG